MTAYIVDGLVTVKDEAGVIVGHWEFNADNMTQLLQNGYEILQSGSWTP